MKTLPIKAGVVYDGGKLMSWEYFLDILNGASDKNGTDKLKKKIQGLIDFTPILIEQATDNKNIANIVGVKIIEDSDKLKKAILKKIETIEKKCN